MTQLVPASWRRSLKHLRDDIHDTIDRWWHRHGHMANNDSSVPVQTVTPQLVEGDVWPFKFPSVLSTQLPLIDIEETDDDVRITAELPGLEKKDFTVDISGERLLRIRGEKKQSSEKKTQGATYTECRYGAFARTVPLPCDVDAEHAKATYKHGTCG